MAEYIEKEAAIKALDERAKHLVGDKTVSIDAIRAFIMNRPTADVAPVVHAGWIHTKTKEDDWGHSFHHWHCSACGWFEGSNPEGIRYCSGCGAKMDKEDEND